MQVTWLALLYLLVIGPCFGAGLMAIVLARRARFVADRGLLKPLGECFIYSGLVLRQAVEALRDWPDSPYSFAVDLFLALLFLAIAVAAYDKVRRYPAFRPEASREQ